MTAAHLDPPLPISPETDADIKEPAIRMPSSTIVQRFAGDKRSRRIGLRHLGIAKPTTKLPIQQKCRVETPGSWRPTCKGGPRHLSHNTALFSQRHPCKEGIALSNPTPAAYAISPIFQRAQNADEAWLRHEGHPCSRIESHPRILTKAVSHSMLRPISQPNGRSHPNAR